MLTTLGSMVFAICEKVFDICLGEGTVNGVALADDDLLFSCPLTPYETTVPIKIPIASVTRMVKAWAKRWAFQPAHKLRAFITFLRN